jgi:acyl-CoA dehydrogenase
MAWDFSTEPEFQAQLDWVEQFCTDEIDPVDLLFPEAAKSRDLSQPSSSWTGPTRSTR